MCQLIIKELVLDLAEILEIPSEELITKIISENKQLMKWINLNPLSEAAQNNLRNLNYLTFKINEPAIIEKYK